MQKYFNINYIYFFTKQYVKTGSNPNEIINNLNVTKLMQELSNKKFKNIHSLASRHMLNYLFDPDSYEPIVNTSCKESIVKHFFKKVNKDTLDQDIYKIRKNNYGFDKSLYYICDGTEKINSRKAQVVIYPQEESLNDIVDINLKNYIDIDPLEVAKKKIQNGLDAEELVYNNIIKNIDKKLLINKILKKFNLPVMTVAQEIDKIIHYS